MEGPATNGEAVANGKSTLAPWRYGLAAVAFFCVALYYDTFVAPTHATSALQAANETSTHWQPHPVLPFMDSSACSIERVAASQFSAEEFREDYLEQRPVIISFEGGVTPGNQQFRDAVQKAALLVTHGEDIITLSSGNRNSYARRETTVGHYIRHMMEPQPLTRRGNETWYHFGDPHHAEWQEVAGLYQLPSAYMRGYTPTLSFGFAATGTGVPFHTHGHVFAEVVYGKKRWWLSPFDREPRYDPDESTLQWLQNTRPTFSAAEAEDLLECVCTPGDLLYIPTNWHHATLNIGETVFMSVFV